MPPPRPPIRRKYYNRPVTVDGLSFDSEAERRRYGVLRLLERQGLIQHLRHHTRLPLHATTPDGRRQQVGVYEVDFDYEQDGAWVLEDTKSSVTATLRLFQWKARHVLIEYGIKVRIVQVR